MAFVSATGATGAAAIVVAVAGGTVTLSGLPLMLNSSIFAFDFNRIWTSSDFPSWTTSNKITEKIKILGTFILSNF